MKRKTSLLLCAAALALPAPLLGAEGHALPVEAAEHTALRDVESRAPADRRAGAPSLPETLEARERAELRSLEQAAAGLADSRAGHIENDTLTTILLVLAIVAVLVIIF